MHCRLRALIGIYYEYSNLDSQSEPVLNAILKWVNDQVLRNLYSNCMECSGDGISVAQVGIVCGESYIVEKYAEPVDATSSKANDSQACPRRSIPDTELRAQSRYVFRILWIFL